MLWVGGQLPVWEHKKSEMLEIKYNCILKKRSHIMNIKIFVWQRLNMERIDPIHNTPTETREEVGIRMELFM